MTAPPFALWLQDLPATAADASNTAGRSGALADMLHNSGPTALTVLALLLITSIFSWTIMISKWRSFREAAAQNRKFVRAFRKSGRLSEVAAVAEQFRPSPARRGLP